MARTSPYFTPTLFEQLKGLTDRIHGVTHIDKNGSWMGGKLSKPSLDSIGGWLEGRFTKLVTGDSESMVSPEQEAAKASERGFVGPFSHYSTISSTTTSTSPSPQPSVINTNTLPRAGSAMSNRPLSVPTPIDRAASAMDYTRHRHSPVQHITSASASAGPATTTFSESSSFTQISDITTTTGVSKTPRDSEGAQEVSWWSGLSYANSNQTPTAATFVQVANTGVPPTDGFISLMDNAPMVTAAPSGKNSYQENRGDDEEDLGFGNSKGRQNERPSDHSAPQTERPPPQNANPENPCEYHSSNIQI